MRKRNLQAAFTLAEVLISLTIIGVIAAITVPALIQRTNKQEYVTALQKAYSVLSNAANQILAENGSPKCSEGGWACSDEDVYNMFKKYLSNVKECGTAAGCFFAHSYKYFNGSSTNGDFQSFGARLELADGMQIVFYENNNQCGNDGTIGSNGSCSRIGVDLNGAKGPNKYGRDYFIFTLKETGVFPAGCDNNSSGCSNSKWGLGHACACRVLREGKMDY